VAVKKEHQRKKGGTKAHKKLPQNPTKKKLGGRHRVGKELERDEKGKGGAPKVPGRGTSSSEENEKGWVHRRKKVTKRKLPKEGKREEEQDMKKQYVG